MYTINIGSILEDSSNYENITFDTLLQNTDKTTETEHFREWFFDKYPDATDMFGFDKEELMSEFLFSYQFYELSASFDVIYNYAHILNNKSLNAISEKILEIYDCCPDIVILYIDELDVFVIALTACGLDLSDQIELAYWSLDYSSPVKSSSIENSRIKNKIKEKRNKYGHNS